MGKVSLSTALILCLFFHCSAQDRNERPMYGGIPPSPEEARADQKLIDSIVKMFSRAGSLEPSYQRSYFNWAVSLFFKQDYQGAWQKIKEAEQVGGDSIDQKFIRDLTKKMPRP